MNLAKKILLVLAALIIVVLLGIAFLWHEPTPAKTAYINGQILSMDESSNIHEALLTDGERIVLVGKTAEIEQRLDAETTIVDLKGRTMLPGFIDAHGHFPGSGLAVFSADLNSPPIGSVVNISDLLARLKSRADLTDKGEWVLGFGYDDSLLKEHRHPTKEDLDSVSKDHPIFIMHISGHMGVGNSAALAAIGIDESSPDPEGGKIERDSAGRLTGLLLETAARPAQLQAMDFGALDLLKMIGHAAKEYAAVGVTTAQSGATQPGFAQGLEYASKLRLVPFRLVIFPIEDSLGVDILNGHYDPQARSTDTFTVGPIKIVSDGSIQGYTGYLNEPYHKPYHGDEAYRGFPIFEQEQLTEMVAKFHGANLQVAIHANGDAAIEATIEAFREAQKLHPRSDARPIIIHAQMATQEQLRQMHELGMTPSFFSAHTYYWGDRHRDIFMGPERAARMSPARSALEEGVRFTVHLDTPVVPMNPLLLVWSTVNRLSSTGEVIGENERISPMQALRAVTIDAAWQVYQEDNRGSLEPGKWADMVILSGDPLSAPESIKDLYVEQTIVSGRVIYKRR